MSDKIKNVWGRTGGDVLGLRVYAVVLGLSLMWTVFILVLGMQIGYEQATSLIGSLIGFMGMLIAISIYSKTDKPAGSLAGVSMLSLFMGLMIGPLLRYYDVTTISKAIILTLAVTIVMGILGMLFPKAVKGMGGFLFAGLAFLLVAWLAQIILAIFGFYTPMTLLDYVATLIFSLYIAYDWTRAFSLPRTIDNAIDASGALIVDIVNLFLTLLRILGQEDNLTSNVRIVSTKLMEGYYKKDGVTFLVLG